jgi:hypothetical protein
MRRGAIILGVLSVIIVAFLVVSSKSILEKMTAEEILVIQDIIDGELHFYSDQGGVKLQKFGVATHYPKSNQFYFSAKEDQGGIKDMSIKTRFNDGAHATISGSVRVDLPLDSETLSKIHTKYGSWQSLEADLIRTVFEKSIYMSGPLMSSKESYAEKRNELIRYIEDQAENGIYKTRSIEEKGVDPMTGVEKTITRVELVEDANSPGGIARQEVSPLITYGLRAYNLSINSIDYADVVDKQIAAQQQAIMEVQTAIANAKKAEQHAITVAEEGKAKAAQSKWEQEVVKAQKVTEAEQVRDVAKLEKEAAAFEKEKQILLGEGEAERKRLVMEADGALKQKLETYTEVQRIWAEAIKANKIVPDVVMGGSGHDGTSNSATQLIDMLNVKTARELSLDMSMKGNK